MSEKLEYARIDAKGKVIPIPKEKIVEELYRQRIAISFEKTASLVRSLEKDTKENLDRVLQKAIEEMSAQVADDFYQDCLHTYMNKYYSTILKIQDFRRRQEGAEYRLPEAPPEELASDLEQARQEIQAEITRKLTAAVQAANTPVQSLSILKQYLERELKRQQNYIGDEVHRFEISAALDALDEEGVETYQVVCASYYEACDACKALHRKKQPVAKAEEGVNLPPLHPNCRCTVGSYMESGQADTESLFDKITPYLTKVKDGAMAAAPLALVDVPSIIAPNPVNTDSEISSVQDLGFYIRNYPKMKISGYAHSRDEVSLHQNVYYYDPETLQGIVLDNGKPVFPPQLSDLEKQLLELMKRRDASVSREEADRLSRQLYQLAAGTSADIDISKPYGYYEMGRDTTEEILQLMKATEEKYAEQQKRFFLSNLGFFYDIVQNNGELDLKNLSAYQTNATYVFDGEIVDRDALGNITYGYFGRYLGFPTTVLLWGAGYAQYQAGTSSSDYFWTSGDDPRDQYRVLQGILWYEKTHSQESTHNEDITP